jgi:hypothetical protein
MKKSLQRYTTIRRSGGLFSLRNATRRNGIMPARDIGLNFFKILVCEAIATAATPGLMCQPRVIVKMIVEKQMECRLAGETEILGENLPQRHFCPSQNPT